MEIAIVGLGSIAAKHIYALKSIDQNFEIKGLRSSRSSAAVEGISDIYSMDEIGKPDFAIISNPTHLHYETIIELASRNIPMFIEKPALHSLDHIDSLVENIESKQLITYVACNLRFHPCLQFLKNQLSKKKELINEVNVYCGSYLPDWRPGKDYRKVYSSNLSMGGGVHLDLFHEMDYTNWLFGSPVAYHSFFSNKSTIGIDAPDYANYMLSYTGFNVSLVLNYYRKDPKRTIEIVFQNETWLVDLINNTITNEEGKIIFSDPEFKMIDSYISQMKYFLSNLKENTIPMNNLKESVEILKISLSDESVNK